jgi:adsorption protein B
VLPLATPLRRLTHGVYCDEFAEFQSRDLPARQELGGFIPSCGVGTGYLRRALEQLASTSANCLFDPGCLTEDYDVGLRLRRQGFGQVFVPIWFLNGKPLATRELFPDRFRSALRQRTRWVLGIAFQCWEKHGWKEGQGYWFWRDRKGLVGNPASLLANLLFLYGAATWLWSRLWEAPWGLAHGVEGLAASGVLDLTLCLLLLRVGVRTGCAARVYGWRFATGAPLRTVWANWVNCAATLSALGRYLGARVSRRPLVWLKTDHRYPSRAALMCHKRRLGEILVRSGYLEEEQLGAALGSRPAGLPLGEHLVRMGMLSHEDLYEALSLQQNLPFQKLEPAQVQHSAAAVLSPGVAHRWKVVPFRLERGKLYVAGPGLPTEEQERELTAATGLEIRFHLITPANLERLARELV